MAMLNNQMYKWMITRGTPILGYLHMEDYFTSSDPHHGILHSCSSSLLVYR